MDLIDAFRRVWTRVREAYESGYMIYERGLQAALVKSLSRSTLPPVNLTSACRFAPIAVGIASSLPERIHKRYVPNTFLMGSFSGTAALDKNENEVIGAFVPDRERIEKHK